MANESVNVWRVYSIDDGTTRLEQVAVPMGPDRTGLASKLLGGTGVIIRRSNAGRFAPWHPAPRRQMIVTLGGWGEIETGDGQKVRLTPGTLVVVEDVDGVGHQTWTDPEEGWHMLFLPFDDETTLT